MPKIVPSCLVEIGMGFVHGVKQYHHFRFERDHPGVVFLKKTATAEEEQRLLLRGVWSPSAVDMPLSITPAGLTLERRKYLRSCMTGSGSTAEKMRRTLFAPTQNLQHTTHQRLTQRRPHPSDHDFKEAVFLFHFKPAFLKATT